MMTAENFAYWLQGFFEITGDVQSLTPEQIKMIKDHLGYVFNQPRSQQYQPPQVIRSPAFPGLDLGGLDLGQYSPPVVTC